MNDPVNTLKERLQALSAEPVDLPQSIYEYICERLTDGHLPEGFGLPPAYTGEKGIMFAPGAMDGIMMYSFGVQPKKEADALYNAIVGESDDKKQPFDRLWARTVRLPAATPCLKGCQRKNLCRRRIYMLLLCPLRKGHIKKRR